MLMALGVAVGIAIGLVRGGRLIRLANPGYRFLGLLIASYLIMMAEVVIYRFTRFDGMHGAVVQLSYGLTLLFLSFNARYLFGVLGCALGTICNLLVISLNAYRMPVGGFSGEVNALGYALADESTRLLFLGDVIRVPVPYLGGMASVGDLLLMIGVAFLVIEAMGKRANDLEAENANGTVSANLQDDA